MSSEKSVYSQDHASTTSSLTLQEDDLERANKESSPYVPRRRPVSLSPTASTSNRASTYSAVVPVDQLATLGLIGHVRVGLRLWRISACMQRQVKDVPNQFYWDLVDIQRPERENLYSSSWQKKARSILIGLLSTAHIQPLVDTLLAFPPNVTCNFLEAIAEDSRSRTPEHGIIPFYSIISTIQAEDPRFFIDNMEPHVFYDMVLVSPPRMPDHAGDPLCSVIPLLSNLAHTHLVPDVRVTWMKRWDLISQSGVAGTDSNWSLVRTGLTSWDLPSFVDCIITDLLDRPVNILHVLVTRIVSAFDIFARKYPSSYDVRQSSHPGMRKSQMHPLHPYVHLSIHLAFRSKIASAIFIEKGILRTLGLLWLYDFPDPNGPADGTQDKHIIRMDMRTGCLLLLGSLSRHVPGALEVADHVLSLNVPTSHDVNSHPLRAMSLISHAADTTGQYAALSALEDASGRLQAIPSLSLFFVDRCAANGVALATANSTRSHGWNLWGAIESCLLNYDRNSDDAWNLVQDTMIRVILSIASSPQDSRIGLEHKLYTWSSIHVGGHRPFYYMFHQFLQASRDPQAMSEENQKALRSLYRRAVSQNLHVVNPVDRLLMMFAEVTQKSAGQDFTLVLQNAGVDQLLHAAELGLYDFLGDTPPNAMQLKSRKEYCTTILWALSSHKDFQLRPRQGGSSQQKMVAREPTRVSPTSTTCT